MNLPRDAVPFRRRRHHASLLITGADFPVLRLFSPAGAATVRSDAARRIRRDAALSLHYDIDQFARHGDDFNHIFTFDERLDAFILQHLIR